MSAKKDNRKHPRVVFRFPLKFRETMASPPTFRGAQAKDISLGGLRFHTENFLPRQTSLVIEFTLPDMEKAVRTTSEVSWSKSTPSGYSFEIGSQFTDITLSDKELDELRKALSKLEE